MLTFVANAPRVVAAGRVAATPMVAVLVGVYGAGFSRGVTPSL